MTAPADSADWAGSAEDDGPTRRAAAPESKLWQVVAAQRHLACSELDEAGVFQSLADCVLDVFGATGALAGEPVGDTIVARATAGTSVPPAGTAIPQAGTLAGLAVRTGQPQLCFDGDGDGRERPEVNSISRTRSSVVAPLVHAGQVIGLVSAISPVPHAFDDDDLELLGQLTDVATAALRGARLRVSAREITGRSEAILESLDEGLVEIDPSGAVIFANSTARRMTGAAPEQPATVTDAGYDFLWPDLSSRPLETLPAAVVLATGEPRHDDVVGLRRADGSVRWLVVNAVPRTVDGVVVSAVASYHDVTERRREEAAHRVAAERLRAATSLTGLAWWTFDLRTGRHEWSDEMFRLVGREPGDEPPGLDDFLAMVHPDDRPSPAQAGSAFGTGHRSVFRVVRPDGSVRHLQSWNEVETDNEGSVLRVVGATIDVTEREQALQSLEVSRGHLSAALDLTRTATWEWDVHSDRVTWSERMAALMGRAPDAPPPRVEDFLDCLHPDDRARMAELGQRQVSTGRGEEALYRVLLADGTVRHIRALTAVRTGADGTVTHLWGTAVDVTDQVESAARVAASEEHFRTAFDNAPTGMSMISLAPESLGRYLRANDAFLEMVGYARDELVGTPLLDLTHPADRDRDAQRLDRLVSGRDDELAFEKRYVRRDGTAIHARVRTSVARGHQGQPLFLITHAQDVTAQLAEQAELERLALTDNLTGLANRSLLTDRMDHALARLQRTGGSVAMLLLDVDRFKLVNDSLGHQVGDALLVEMAGRIEAVSRADATVARLGGDEFVVLVEGLREPEEIHGVASRLIETLRRPYNLGPHAESLVATVSVGVSVATSAASSHVDLYREADLALYRAKDAGRDQYALFDDALRARAVGRMRAETLLRQAIAQDRLVAVFQPVVDLTDGTVRAAEGLVRIQDFDGGLVPPSEFIDVAEETGLIVEVDARMFELVAKEYARVAALPDVSLRLLSTNVSARSLEDPGFVDRVRRTLTWFGVPGSAIRVELTERSLLTSSPAVRESLERLSSLGVQVGLDDFGTGYSALAYLQRFTLTFLKIDRSFVRRLGMSSRDDAVVAAVVDLAHAHDLVVIAEGVETAEQMAALRAMGCDRAQGYLIGRPMPSADLEALLRADPRW